MSNAQQAIEAEIPYLRRYALLLLRDRDAADDLVQDTLERALLRLHTCNEQVRLRPWLFAILYNRFVSDYRKRVRENAVTEAGDLPETGVAAQEDRVALRELERALWQLPEDQRVALLLVGMEGMSYEEAASVLDVPVGTLRSRLSRGRRSLRLRLEGQSAEPRV
ncbi:MAG TPA: sigma-70 family RNA polymerase sigma factor [Kiloniellales bacterium]|jgi:RNA polymerase sigma-70 factor (ECF subfamily)|nr:sigma-70 family RNA polymerase sigma factor [Kiloniellales bacterium]